MNMTFEEYSARVLFLEERVLKQKKVMKRLVFIENMIANLTKEKERIMCRGIPDLFLDDSEVGLEK